MQVPAGGAARRCPEEAHLAIERFLKASRQPALLEPGEEPIPLSTGCFALDWNGSRLTIQAWDGKRNLARRIIALEEEKPGRVILMFERFNKRTGTLWLIDLARPANESAGRRGERLAFRERFRKMLTRQFTGWRVAELTADADLEHSLSPAYPRALLKQGGSGWAAIAATPASDAAGVLTFGLVWLDHLRRRERRTTIEGLAIYVPGGKQRTTTLRLRAMNPHAARFSVFVYDEQGYEEPLDPADWGNLDTRLDVCRSVHPCRRPAWLPDVAEALPRNDGAVSLRVRGLEFARLSEDRLLVGFDRKRPLDESRCQEAAALAGMLGRLRSAEAPDRAHPLYSRAPESWLESQARANIEQIDASLLPDPIYGQVPAMAGGERGIIDLLATDHRGRLAVVELKASEEIHLPLQALDYWMRVKWHAQRGEFAAKGYFPGTPLVADPPRLLLVAPALAFHPTTETLLRYFSPEIEVERIGVAVEWRKALNVAFRARGSEKLA
jgi:hypothetical protein